MSDELPPLPETLSFLRDVVPPAPPAGFEDAVASRLATSWASASVVKGLSLAKLVSGGAALVLVGVGLGVALDRTFFPPAPVEVRVEVPAPTGVPAAEPPVTRVKVPLVADAGVPAVVKVRAVGAPKVEATRDLSLSAERGLLEVARSALAKGDLAGAFTALAQHERDFAQGRLEEEREALVIKALHTAGREPEAAARTARFQQRFPDSLLLP